MEKIKINVGDYVKVFETSHSKKESLIKKPVKVIKVWGQNRIVVETLDGIFCRLDAKSTNYQKISTKEKGNSQVNSKISEILGGLINREIKVNPRNIIKNINIERLKYFLATFNTEYFYKTVPNDIHFMIIGNSLEEIHESEILSTDVVIENWEEIRKNQLREDVFNLINSLKVGDYIIYKENKYKLIENHSLCYLTIQHNFSQNITLIPINNNIELGRYEKVVVKKGDYIKYKSNIYLVEEYNTKSRLATIFEDRGSRMVEYYKLATIEEIEDHLTKTVGKGDLVVKVGKKKIHIIDQIKDDYYITTKGVKLDKKLIREATYDEVLSIRSKLITNDEFLSPILCKALLVTHNINSCYFWRKNRNKEYELVDHYISNGIPAFVGTDLIQHTLPEYIVENGLKYKRVFVKNLDSKYSCSYVNKEFISGKKTNRSEIKINVLLTYTKKTTLELALEVLINIDSNNYDVK